MAFVSLGDDDVNIEVSIHLRNLFDRVNGIIAQPNIGWRDEIVDIYSIVYDDQKSSILYIEGAAEKDAQILLNHDGVPYHIHFIGGMSSQFDYENIYDAELEECAREHHRRWSDVEENIYNEWLQQRGKVYVDGEEWDFKSAKNDKIVKKTRKKYEQYEYYRLSSIAKELYQREIKRNKTTLLAQTVCLEDEKKQTCVCKNCIRRKKSEHMRWNAYTRVIGYAYKKDVRADRALLHKNLCAWENLSEREKQKD